MSQPRLFKVMGCGDYSDQASEFQCVIDELRAAGEHRIADSVEELRELYALPSHALILRPCTLDGDPVEDFDTVIATMQALLVHGVVEVVEASDLDRRELA